MPMLSSKGSILAKCIATSHACSSLHVRYATSNIASSNQFDAVIVGGGIVGLATAREISLRYPSMKLALLEKESQLSQHQSKNNSGVIHAGIYYEPGSLKATLCLEGLKRSYEYLERYKLPYRKAGKLIVAVTDVDLPRLDNLMERAIKNKVPGVRMVSADEIQQIEPNCRGKKALYSPETGIVDWSVVAHSFGENFQDKGGKIYKDFQAGGFNEAKGTSDFPVVIENLTPAKVTLSDQPQSVQCKYVITCCGLQSDRVARLSGCSKEPAIVPFRGDYLKLKNEYNDMVKVNIYPVPNPNLPFLGVHFTPRIDGTVWLGPTAVLSFAREGYGYFDFNLRDMKDELTHPGLLRLGKKYLGFGVNEFVSNLIVKRQVKQLQRFVPSLRAEHVERGPSGIRAQAISRDGKLVDDFVIDAGSASGRVMHVRNAPSPAATSSMAIARLIADKAKDGFDWPQPQPRTQA